MLRTRAVSHIGFYAEVLTCDAELTACHWRTDVDAATGVTALHCICAHIQTVTHRRQPAYPIADASSAKAAFSTVSSNQSVHRTMLKL
jgi:hypothetical protein